MTLSHNASDTVRRSLLAIDQTTLLDFVAGFDLRPQPGLDAAVAVPLRGLQQKRNVDHFASTAPLKAIFSLLHLLSAEPLEQIIDALGDHAEAPTYDQLVAAIATAKEHGATRDGVVCVLAFAIGQEFPAAVHCQRLFDEDPEYALPTLANAPAPVAAREAKVTSDDVKEKRRARREAEKAKKKPAGPVRPAKAAKVKVATPAPVASAAATTPAPEVRRSVRLTPHEAAQFDPNHALAGAVVHVSVPYSDVDMTAPEQTAKDRYALVVAAGEGELLVRGIYSKEGADRAVFGAWRRLGLSHVSYLGSDHIVVTLGEGESYEKVGDLTTAEWNAQL